MRDSINPIAHINVETSRSLPTVRAALFRAADKDKTPIWVSVSFYLIHQKPRGFKGEGLSPILKSTVADCPSMKMLAEFVDREFDRLKNI